MPRLKKPKGWPKYMQAKTLSDGSTAYFWNVPTAFRKQGCHITSEALGTDYGAAKRRCDIVLNPSLDDWRRARDGRPLPAPILARNSHAIGTINWLIAEYQRSSAYKKTQASTQRYYDQHFRIVQRHIRPSGKPFGLTLVEDIKPRHADDLYQKLVDGGTKTDQRFTTAANCIGALARAWKVVHRHWDDVVPLMNPFEGVETQSSGEVTVEGSYDDLLEICDKADEMGYPAVGTAVMISFHWLQRQIDIVDRLAWTDYEPGNRVRVVHNKTKQLVWLQLSGIDDRTGRRIQLFPDLEDRLAKTKKQGTLMIMRDRPDPKTKVIKPYNTRLMQKHFRLVADAAGFDRSLEFASFRHGGFTEAADSGATDAELMAMGGHKTRETLSVYTKRTNHQAASGAVKRLRGRTKND